MPHTTLSAIVATARRSAGASAPVATDGELLARFVATRDEPAFAELVRRLGPMVLGVCRRVAGDGHLADDAFQAAFVVLARRAADVRPREAVRGWVYGVAVRVAREARAVSARRRAREVPVPVLPDRAAEPAEPPDADALRILDEEIAGLPDHLRAAVVLCELDGLARKDAARRLGVPDGTLSSRLAKARKLLADRLRKRGIAPSAAGLSAALGSHATARVPAALAARALASALSPGVVPAAVAALSTGVLRIMFAQKLKAVLALATVALGALACAALAAGDEPPVPPPALAPKSAAGFASRFAAPVPPPAAPREGAILVTSSWPAPTIDVRTPAGEELPAPALGKASAPIDAGDPPTCTLVRPRLSPDGKRLMAFKLGPIPQDNVGPWTPNHLWVFDLDAKDGPAEPLLSDLRCPSAVFSADGTKLYGSQVDPEKVGGPREDGKPVPLVSWEYDLKAKKKASLALPPGHGVADISPDGKMLLTVVYDPFDPPSTRSYLVPLDTFKPRLLTKTAFKGMRFSPDGRWVLGNRSGKATDVPPPAPLAVVAVADGKEHRIPLPDGALWLYHACWSPDGKRVAYFWHEKIPPPAAQIPVKGNPPKLYAGRVTVADADGRNAKTIVRRDDWNVTGLDWK